MSELQPRSSWCSAASDSSVGANTVPAGAEAVLGFQSSLSHLWLRLSLSASLRAAFHFPAKQFEASFLGKGFFFGGGVGRGG